MRPTEARIDLNALAKNLSVIRDAADSRTVMAVVKANAYGHGAVPVSRRLSEEGIADFAVATVTEGLELRDAGIGGSILVFGAADPADFAVMADHDLEVTAGSDPIVSALQGSDRPLSVHINVDTGMTRLGLSPKAALAAVRMIDQKGHLTLAGLYTHLTAADRPALDIARKQMSRWEAFLDALGERPCPVHVVSSGGILGNPAACEDTDVVRAGIALYGLYQGPGTSVPGDFRPVMRLVSRVARIAGVSRATPVSYGATWIAPDETRILTVSAGYADGYPRRLSNKGFVGIQGCLMPVVGTICMDMMMVHVADSDLNIEVGDEVVLFGPGGPKCADLARLAGTITYEIACGISARVPRVYD